MIPDRRRGHGAVRKLHPADGRGGRLADPGAQLGARARLVRASTIRSPSPAAPWTGRPALQPRRRACRRRRPRGRGPRRAACRRPARTGRGARLRQQREDPAAVVVDHHQAQVRPRLAGPEDQAVLVVQERQVAHERVGGPVVRQRRAHRRGHQPVDARRRPGWPAAGARAGAASPGPGRGSACEEPQNSSAPFGQRADQVAGQPRLAEARRRRAPRRPRRARPPRRPAARRAARCRHPRPPGSPPPAATWVADRVGSGQRPRSRGDHDVLVGAAAASDSSGRGQPGPAQRDHHVGPVRVGELGRRRAGSGRRTRVVAVAGAAVRLGSTGQPAIAGRGDVAARVAAPSPTTSTPRLVGGRCSGDGAAAPTRERASTAARRRAPSSGSHHESCRRRGSAARGRPGSGGPARARRADAPRWQARQASDRQ